MAGLTFTPWVWKTEASLSKLPAKQIPHLVHVTPFSTPHPPHFLLTLREHNESAGMAVCTLLTSPLYAALGLTSSNLFRINVIWIKSATHMSPNSWLWLFRTVEFIEQSEWWMSLAAYLGMLHLPIICLWTLARSLLPCIFTTMIEYVLLETVFKKVLLYWGEFKGQCQSLNDYVYI